MRVYMVLGLEVPEEPANVRFKGIHLPFNKAP
jgi:hypothetical protein